MKNFFFLLTISAWLVAPGLLTAQTLVTMPDKPSPGDQITVVFNAENTKLKDEKNIDAIAYLFNSDQPEAVELELTDNGEGPVAQLQTTPETKAILLSFKSEDGSIIENNDKKGYKILLYRPDKSEKVQGAYASKAMIYQNYNFLTDTDRDSEKAFNLLKTEFRLYPSSRENASYLNTYAFLAKNQKDEEAMEDARKVMNEILSDKKSGEDRLMLASNIARHLEGEEKSREINEMIADKFPKGRAAMFQVWNKFREAGSTDDKISIAKKFGEKFAGAEGFENLQDRMLQSIAGDFAKEENWDAYQKYLNKVSAPTDKAGSLNQLAWGMSGESLEAEGRNIEMAKKLSKQSLELIKEAIRNADELKPSYYTTKQWEKNLEYSYAMYADTYALLAYKSGDAKEALHYQQIACDQNDFGNAEMNERYAVFYQEVNGKAATEDLLAKLIAEGNANSAMKDHYKTLFMENNTLESAYDKMVTELERTAMEKMKAEIKKKMFKEDAPSFTLVDLDGKEVSLESLKGKVVVLDFWATWCGPCKASFPGMQKAVNKYAGNDDVVFYFVNTWERAEDKAKNAGDYIRSEEYTFNVLMDTEDKVVASYGVSGIPTKFVIDKEGNIVFKSTGYGGNDEELVSELSLMIEMAKETSGAGLSGAP